MRKTLLTLVFGLCAIMGYAQTSKTYTDDLTVTIDGQTTPAQESNIEFVNNGDGTCTFSLKEFTLRAGTDSIPVGNIVLENVPLTEGKDFNTFTTSQKIIITPGEDPSMGWIGPMLDEVPIEMTGKINEKQLYCTIDIDMVLLKQKIQVVFGKDITSGGTQLPSKTYTDDLTVTINNQTTPAQESNIEFVNNGDGTCTFSLKEFTLRAGTDSIPVGNIVLENVPLTEGKDFNTFTTSQKIIITPGEDPSMGWIGAILGEVPIEMTGKINEEQLYCTIDIDMALLKQKIQVVFGKDIVTGITHVTVPVNGKVDVYSLNGILLRRGVAQKDALNGLQRGIYIVNGKKVVKD